MNAFPSNTAMKSLMLCIRDLAELLQCSERHITNLWKSGRMPPPVKLGAIVRWSQAAIENWIKAGCPPADEWPTTMENCAEHGCEVRERGNDGESNEDQGQTCDDLAH